MTYLFIWTHEQDKLKQFLVDLNKFHSSIKLSLKIITDLHIKAADRHQYQFVIFNP